MTIRNFTLVFLILLSTLFISACKKSDSETADSLNQNQNEAATPAPVNADSLKSEVTLSPSGFGPSELKLKAGQVLVWNNKSSEKVEIGSDPHPAHTDNQDITGGQFVLTLDAGESKSIIVATKGSWGYHNHFNPSQKGTIIVE